MIVVDASALLAIYLNEPERAEFSNKLDVSERSVMSPINYWEAVVRARSLDGEQGAAEIRELLNSFEIEIASVDAAAADGAIAAFVNFSTAPARLNLGDCFAYALAKMLDAPLLFKGNDFVQTDIVAA